MQVSTAEFRKGLRIVFDGEPYTIVDFQHVKPGKGGAFVRTKLKHMRQGRVIDNTFRSGEKVELVDFEDKHMQFLYKDDRFHFMDMRSEEHTSELQSRLHLVCRLLLEKKNILQRDFARVGIGIMDGGIHGLIVTQ